MNLSQIAGKYCVKLSMNRSKITPGPWACLCSLALTLDKSAYMEIPKT